MPKLIVDGRPVEVAPGTKVIEACKAVGVVVPHFCYHPGLSIAGNCRMCMVEISMGGRSRVAVACVEPATEGMEVRTVSEEVLDARRGVMEFLLLNHPIDCPYCDCAGECKLQDYYMEWGNIAEGSRRETEAVHKPKRQPIGPHVMLDSERCVLCTRCVRFCDEVTGTGELGIEERGTHSTLHLAEGKTLDNPYSGNVVDLCPVGALTDRDFRFQRRVWFLKKVDSICPGCSRGCNTEIQFDLKRDYKNEVSGRRVIRLKPRFNAEINQWWLCDRGRYGFGAIDERRLLQARVKREGRLLPAEPGEALAEAARLVGDFARRHPDQLALLASPQSTSEALLAARAVFVEGLKLHWVDHALPQDPLGDEDGLLMKADLSPNRAACEALRLRKGALPAGGLVEKIEDGTVKGLVVFRRDLPALLGERAAELLGKLRLLVVFATHEADWGDAPDVLLPAAVYAEEQGSFVNFQGRVQRVNRAFAPLGAARPEFDWLLELARLLGLKPGFATLEGAQRLLAAVLPDMAGLAAPAAPQIPVSKEAAPR
jgi:NADH-quinone oxidoreductase subunit G